MTNRLAEETSPYLLQHADNPVDWYPWGDEALALARQLDRPILLSIGYAACHWCHVMAHESFEDPATAELMNRSFVNIKVDREERPDLDSIYMDAVVALTGQGGWPMTVIMTPDGRPFYGGTYFPPEPRYGMPSFQQVIESVAQAWEQQRERIERSAVEITAHLRRIADAGLGGAGSAPDKELVDRALSGLLNSFDSREGGFGRAPKFPPSMTLEFLLRAYLQRGDAMALHMAEHTLKKMAHGGLYDQIGGGFARYSTDDRWLVPHFEKMLYDNALLARVYLHAWQVTGDPLYRQVVEETLDFAVRELRHPDGGFYSSYDADSEGEEGKFYVWSAAEVREALGDDAPLFMAYYDVSDGGNWEGHNILNVPGVAETAAAQFGLEPDDMGARLAEARDKLYELRSERVWPGLDDKVLTAWNGLMLAAFAEAGRALDRPDYSAVATANAQFLHDNLRQANGRLLRAWKAGASGRYNGYLEDYAYLADGLLALYQATFDVRWYEWARELAGFMLDHFHDDVEGGFFDTSDDHEILLTRPKDIQDNAIPSANAMAAQVLLRLSLYEGNGRYWDTAAAMLHSVYDLMTQHSNAFAHWLCAATLLMGEPQEVAIVGDLTEPGTQALLGTAFAAYRPNQVVVAGSEDGAAAAAIPLMAGRQQVDGQPAAYVCRQFVCQLPVTTPAALEQQLAGSPAPS